MEDYTHDLCLPPALYQCLSLRVFRNSLDIICNPTGQASDAQEPEKQSYGQCYPFLDAGGLRFKMERYDNGHADDGHVYAQSKPREKSSFIGTVISSVGRFVREEQGSEDWTREEERGSRGAGND